MVYQYDVTIYSHTQEDHIKHVQKSRRLFNDSSVTLKLKKCSLFSGEVEFLGHFLKPGKLDRITKAIKGMKETYKFNGIMY